MSKQPEPLVRGRFALYETADGGFHFSFRIDGESEDRHIRIPPLYVRLARKHLSSMRRKAAWQPSIEAGAVPPGFLDAVS